jgi:hypothetical protein
MHGCLWVLLPLGCKADAHDGPCIHIFKPRTQAHAAVKHAHQAVSTTSDYKAPNAAEVLDGGAVQADDLQGPPA